MAYRSLYPYSRTFSFVYLHVRISLSLPFPADKMNTSCTDVTQMPFILKDILFSLSSQDWFGLLTNTVGEGKWLNTSAYVHQSEGW